MEKRKKYIVGILILIFLLLCSVAVLKKNSDFDKEETNRNQEELTLDVKEEPNEDSIEDSEADAEKDVTTDTAESATNNETKTNQLAVQENNSDSKDSEDYNDLVEDNNTDNSGTAENVENPDELEISDGSNSDADKKWSPLY